MIRLTAAAAVVAITLLAPGAALATPPPTPDPPQVDSTLPAGNIDNAGSVDFTFSSTDPDAAFQCALDSAPLADCDVITSYDGLAEGTHTLTAVAVDAGTSSPTVVHFTEDYTAPAPPVVHGPPASTSDPDATLTFTGESGATIECSLDGDTFTTCTSPLVEVGLPEGDHQLQVRQTDVAGNVGDPATYDWTVDTTAPDAPALSTGVASVTGSSSATFAFSGESGGHFECALNGAAFTTCTSPITYHGLGAGFDEIVVQQVDAAGNVGNQSVYDWQVDPSLNPAIVGPPAPVVTTPVPVLVPPAPTPAITPPTKPVSKTVVKAPVCVSRRSLTVHWRLPKGQTVGAPQLLINGRLVARLAVSARSVTINLVGRPAGVFHVVIRARTSRGVVLQTTRSYATCVARNDTAPLQTLVLTPAR